MAKENSLLIDTAPPDGVAHVLPDGWRFATIEELSVRVFGGGTPSTKNPSYWDGSIPWTTSAIIEEDAILLDKYQRTITPKGLASSSCQVAPRGSILVGTRVGVGKAVVAGFDIGISQDLTAIVLKEDALPDFLALSLKQPAIQAWFELNKRGTTIKGVTRKDLTALKVPLPSIPEQRAIAHVLRTVQRAKEATEKVIAATRQLKQSLMKHLFTYGPVPFDKTDQVKLKETEIGPVPEGWEVVSLKNFVERTQQRNPRGEPDKPFQYVDVSSVSRESLRIESSATILGKDAPSRARKVMKRNDVLFATVRPSLKRIAMVPNDLDGQICSTGYCILRAREESLNPQFLYFTVSYDGFVKRVSAKQRGSSYPAVSDKVVKEEYISLPPLTEQHEIASKLRTLDQAIRAEKDRKQALHILFQSLLHYLMTGKVRVRDIELPEEAEVS